MSVHSTESSAGVNQNLIIQLLLQLGEPYQYLGEQLRENPYPENWRKAQRELLEAFPFMVSNQLRDLFTFESCENNSVRIQDLFDCAHTVLRLVASILLADVWRHGEAADIQLSEEETSSIRRYFNLNDTKEAQVNYRELFQHLATAFRREQLSFFLPSLSMFLTDKKVIDAIQFFELTSLLDQKTDISHTLAEEHLTTLLLASTFLSKNELRVVKQVATDWTRDFDEPTFIQHEALLKGQDYRTGGVATVSQTAINYSQSILLVCKEDQHDILNLSPFLVDQNSYKVKSYHLPKVYFLTQANAPFMTFQHSDASDLYFVLERDLVVPGFTNTDRLFVAWEKFCHTFELTD